jgi:hypothetical protein
MKAQANIDWAARGKHYIEESLAAESKADKVRLTELFSVIRQSGLEKEAVSAFIKGCKEALLASGMTEEAAKVRLSEIRRFFRVAAVALDDLEKAYREGQGYHAIMALCSDLAELHDVKGKGGRKKAEKTGKAEKVPERVVIKEEYSLDEIETVMQSLTADQVYVAALFLAARAREFAETSVFGEKLVRLVDEFTLPEEAGEVADDEEAVKAELRSLLSQAAA